MRQSSILGSQWKRYSMALAVAAACSALGARALVLQPREGPQFALSREQGPANATATTCLADGGFMLASAPHETSHADLTTFQDDDYRGLFFHPEKKFAFCFIPKVACSSWTDVLWKIFQDNRDGLPNGADRYTIGITSQKAFGVEGYNKVFNDPTATRAVFVRDPLARFVSGFLNKCFMGGCRGYTVRDACNWRTPEEVGKAIPISRAVEGIIRNTNLDEVNSHYRHQSSQCALKKHIREYNVVGVMTKDGLASEASCLMETAGLSRFNTRGPPEYLPYWEAPANWSDSNHALGGLKLESNFTEEDMLQRLFTKDAARKLIDWYREDYELFNLPEPAWVEHATGEWYRAVPDGCHKVTDAVTDSIALSETLGSVRGLKAGPIRGDEDDIRKLVLMAGYMG